MENVQKFAASIKKKYRERRINCEKQWPPCHSNKLVRLEIVEREKGEGYSANIQRGREDDGIKRTPIAYGDLFKEINGKRPVRKVLVEGDAGIGKTTLCIAVSEDWANENLFQQFELVLLLPLRMKVVALAGSLPELFKLLHPSPRLCDSVTKHLEDSEDEGESVLIIADGWDELSESERQECSFLFQLLFEQFPLLSVILTSRPSASASLHQLPCIDRFIEVRGFSKEHIVEYIQSEFASDQDKAGRLLEQLENNPLVESVCSVPLNCAIVCHLWRTLEEALPTTMTELYTKIILQLILRNIRKIDTYSSILSLPNFDALPADLQQSWWLLCEFAYQALERDQLVFSIDELDAFFPEGSALDKRILCFGLLQSAESIGLGISFHFLHLTFQEYLAALHLSRQPPDKQLDFFQSHKSRGQLFPKRLIMVNKFFFGINCFVDDFINSFICQIFECIAGGSSRQDVISLCHCAFEAQYDLINDQLAQYLVSHRSYSLVLPKRHMVIYFGYPCTAHDCSAILYTIANIQECDSVEINFVNCGIRESQVKHFLDILANKKGKLQIVALTLSSSRLLTVSSLEVLENAVRGDLLAKLEELDLSGSLTSDTDTNAAWLTTFVETLSAHCPYLYCLDLSDNNLGVPGATAISKMYDYAICGESSDYRYGLPRKIILNRTNIGDNGFITLIKSPRLKVVSDLAVMGNDIRTFGVSCLADAVCSGKLELAELEFGHLNLRDNPLGLEGSISVGRIISSSHCQHVFIVCLSRCELTTVGAGLPNTNSLNITKLNTITSGAIGDIGQQLCQMPQSSTIRWLELNGNRFTGEGIHILAGFIHLCPYIANLHTNDCDITSDDLILLLDRLTQLKRSSPSLCSKLGSWSLLNNQISDSGVSALIDHLPLLFPCWVCEAIFLQNNPISNEMMKSLEDELKGRKEAHSRSKEPDPMLREYSPLLYSQMLSTNSGDITESITERFTYILPSLSSTVLSLMNVSDGTIQCADQPENQPLQQESCSDTLSGASLDLQYPPSKRQKRDFSDLTDIEHHLVDLIKWEDENGIKRELRIYSKIAHKWRQIATRLGFELGEIESVEENHHRNNSRITAVLRRWFENAKSLPNASRYPKSWQGLINLLEDTELGEVAEKLKKALSSPQNSVGANLI